MNSFEKRSKNSYNKKQIIMIIHLMENLQLNLKRCFVRTLILMLMTQF